MVKNASVEIGQRRRDIAARLPQLKADALLVSGPANVRYLSDYTGSNGLVLLLPSETHFFTDPRYEISARQNIAGHVHIVKGPLIAGVIQVIKRKRLKKIGFESSWTQFDAYQRLKETLPLGVSLVPVGRIIEERRMVKSPGRNRHHPPQRQLELGSLRPCAQAYPARRARTRRRRRNRISNENVRR